MPLLVEVRHTDSGLEGVTTSGDSIKLSAPTPKVRLLQHPPAREEQTREGQDRWINNVVNDLILPELGDDKFVQMGGRESSLYNAGIAFAYNEYSRRE